MAGRSAGTGAPSRARSARLSVTCGSLSVTRSSVAVTDMPEGDDHSPDKSSGPSLPVTEPPESGSRLPARELGRRVEDAGRSASEKAAPVAHVIPLHRVSVEAVRAFLGRRGGERHAGFTIARFDRLRVLTTELRRLAAKGNPVCVRLAPRATLSGERLARILGWL